MTSPRRRRLGTVLRLVAAVALVLPLGGCLRGCASSRPPIHLNPNMDDQPKYRAQEASAFFYDGAAMRPVVAGTVARGELFEDVAFHTGKDEAGAFVANPLAVDEAVLARGAERYGIYCTPCHGERGNGRGTLYTRSQVEAADLRLERIRAMPDGQMFDVVTNGFGLMASYAYQVPPRDRWAIIAWVRELERQARATEAMREELAAETGTDTAPDAAAEPTAAPATEPAPAAAEEMP